MSFVLGKTARNPDIKWLQGPFLSFEERQLMLHSVTRLEVTTDIQNKQSQWITIADTWWTKENTLKEDNTIGKAVDEAQRNLGDTLAVLLASMTKLREFKCGSSPVSIGIVMLTVARWCLYELPMTLPLVSRLAEMQSLTHLSISLPNHENFPSLRHYEEAMSTLTNLVNLTHLECYCPVGKGRNDAGIVARILVKAPRVVSLLLHPYDGWWTSDSESELDQFFSKICTTFSEYLDLSTATSSLSDGLQTANPAHPTHVKGRLSLKSLKLSNGCLLGPEIHSLTDTATLEYINICHWNEASEGEDPDDGTSSALETLVGRAPKLHTIAYQDCHRLDRYSPAGVDLQHAFPNLSELVLSKISDGRDLVDGLNACGIAGANAGMWERLTLLWEDDNIRQMEELVSVYLAPVLEFIAECSNLTHLRTHIHKDHWV